MCVCVCVCVCVVCLFCLVLLVVVGLFVFQQCNGCRKNIGVSTGLFTEALGRFSGPSL